MQDIITIDGPSAVGKGTLTKKLAKAINYRILDSGKLYRKIAILMSPRGFSSEDIIITPEKIGRIDKEIEQVNLDNRLREETIALFASKIAQKDEVREYVLKKCREIFKSNKKGLIADGRDMGTTVFPEARQKFFLKASYVKRAERRYKQMGGTIDYKNILRKIKKRDLYDTSRVNSPMIPAKDAIIINTDDLGIMETFELVYNKIKKFY